MTILRKQFLEHVAQTSPSPLLVEVERAEGLYFYSPSGKRYMDLVSGVSVNNVGHGNAQVVEAVCAQMRSYGHVMVYGELVEKPQVRYATLLSEAVAVAVSSTVSCASSSSSSSSALGANDYSVYFVNSGAEAIEGAMKLTKRYTARTEIISMYGAYHGSTQGAMSIMGGEEFKASYGPLLPDTRLIRFNCFEDLEYITSRTACVVSEVVQGEAGVVLPVEGYLQALRARCTAVGALLVFDEVQTAFGRTGSLFAFERYGVVPDILVLAKALGGGMPLGAFVAQGAVMSVLRWGPALGHITTFGGHPVSTAAGLAALEYINSNDLVNNARMMGEVFERELSDLSVVSADYHVTIRRSGLLMAVELGTSDRMYRAVDQLLECGYMSDWFLFCDTAFRISPPLTISESEVIQVCGDVRRIVENL